MAKKGLSKLVFAKYNATGNTVTYSEPINTEKMAEYSTEIEKSEANNLYLDNDIAETDGGVFNKGTFNVTTGDLSNETSKLLYNVKENEIQYASGKTASELVYDDSMQSQDLGVGLIEMHQVDSKTFYRAIWLSRVQFNIPSNAAVTKGDAIEWQTQEITGNILRSAAVDDSGIHPWQNTADLESEADALEYLMYKGGKTAAPAARSTGGDIK